MDELREAFLWIGQDGEIFDEPLEFLRKGHRRILRPAAGPASLAREWLRRTLPAQL
jgi:hypothetical protein